MSSRLYTGTISRSKSEGTLIDFDGQNAPTNKPDKLGKEVDLLISWEDVFQDHSQNTARHTNPFWNGLSESNPFLDDVVHANTSSKTNGHMSILKEDPLMLFRDSEARHSLSSSGDELDIDHVIERSATRKSGRSKSVSYLYATHEKESIAKEINGQILAPDLEWLQNDREAYKMAWLSHRQLTRSCLDLDVMSQSPGWAQTQATDTHIICKLDHKGGSVQLPNSDITVHVPEGHVGPGEFQDISLKAFLDPPASLNNNLSTTVTPVLEITLSNINTGEALLLEMKIAVEAKNDPYSQVMTEIATFYSYNREGPFEKIPDGYIYKNMLQIKLPILSRITYIVSAAQVKSIQNPSSSVYNYILKSLTVAVYGPKHIHPAFTTVLAVMGHNYTPDKITVDDIKRCGKNLPPLVFHLWGKHMFVLDPMQDLSIDYDMNNSNFLVKTPDSTKIKEHQLKTGKTIRTQFPFSLKGSKEISSFVFIVQIKGIKSSSLISEFQINTPNPAPKIHFTPKNHKDQQKPKGILSTPVMSISNTIKYPKFQDKKLKIHNFAVTLKTVLRQQKIDYFLEYFKGDTIALLGEDKVKAIGQTKMKEWYVGVLRDKVGLVHCKNVKIISKEQVIDFPDAHFTTKMLLEQIALPFKKLTYIYSSVLSNVSDNVYDWRCLADVLGYSHLSLDDLCHVLPEKDSDRVSAVVKKLKEDCHLDSKTRKFHYELIMGLLKMDCQGLVARLTQDTVILTTAVQLGIRWRELAEKLARFTKQQMEAYEIPHQGKSGEVSLQMMWKPAFDFLHTWAAHYGESYRDVLQDLHCALDKMKYPVTRQWRELSGALIFINCLEIFRATSFSKSED